MITEKVINMTYQELKNRYDSNNLLPGQNYRITDFMTRHQIPNTSGIVGEYVGGESTISGLIDTYDDTNSDGIDLVKEKVWNLLPGATITISGSVNGTWDGQYMVSSIIGSGIYWEIRVTGELWDPDIMGATITWNNPNPGVIEPIIVTAVTSNTLDKIALSETYPEDIIYYELTCTHQWNGTLIIGPTTGWIYYREDILNRNKFTYDFRACTWRRFVDADYGYFIRTNPPPIQYEFDGYGVSSIDIYRLGGGNTKLPTTYPYYMIIYASGGIGGNQWDGVYTVTSATEIDPTLWAVVVSESIDFTSIENGTYISFYKDFKTFDMSKYNVDDNTRVKDNDMSGGYGWNENNTYNNVFDATGNYYFINNKFGSDMKENTIIDHGGFYNNIISNGMNNNVLMDNFGQNVIGEDFSSNNFIYINPGNFSFIENKIDRNFRNITAIVNTPLTFRYNVIGREFNNTNFSGCTDFSKNTIGFQCSDWTFGGFFSNNWIGDNFYSTYFGNGFSGNYIMTTNSFENSQNEFGNNCTDNVIQTGFRDNILGDYFSSNQIGQEFYDNQIAANFIKNVIYPRCNGWRVGGTIRSSFFGSGIESINLPVGGDIAYCHFENDSLDSITFDPLVNHDYKHFGSGQSTLEGRIDIDDTLDLSLATYWNDPGGGPTQVGPYDISICGIIWLMKYGTNAPTANITQLINFTSHDYHEPHNPKIIKVESGFKVYLVGTLIPTQHGQFYWDGAVILDGDKQDTITLEQITIGGYNVLREKK